ncbi:glutathionine S-transferase [Prolinoborus fasciculus]|uniref:glutathione S-transferase family protein n=1 Tax=Acinetobacter TaxID=469 RepID=UPI0005145ED3|nr:MULTISPECIES: glutathione S-transferase family protein [Acinetobacter]KGH51639.1 glutathione S-transferase [Acinetobacter idrijaensis]SPJ18944.1 glutathionine S-transferase [Prolinoborus fasciculus]
MKLYNNPQSRGLTLLPLLKELQIEDQIEQVEVAYEHMHQQAYTQMNPMGKVPCLVDQEVVISEMAAIFIYLADKYSDKGLAPALNDPKRGAYLKWMFFCHGPLTEYIDIKNLQVPPENIEKNRRSLSFGNEAAVFDFLKQGIGQASPYLLGEKVSAADLYVAYCLIFAISAIILPPFDEFKPFLQQMARRDSLKDIPWFQEYQV